MAPMEWADLDAAADAVCAEVRPWVEEGGFAFVRPLQDAARNQGRVELMRDGGSEGRLLAVKRMPNRWVCTGPREFADDHPTASERPWRDMAIVKHLNTVGCHFVCDLIAVFRSDLETFVATSFCTFGDLFSWCDHESVPPPGEDREKHMLPIVTQVFEAVRWLHDLGIAHRDLSLENIMLTDGDGGRLNVKIIDFGMATLSQSVSNEIRGKRTYQAPESHGAVPIDTFLADGFALGVVLFSMAVQDYPWTCTKRGACQLFEYVTMFGLRRFLEKRKLRKGNGEHLAEVFSPALAELLEALLQVRPESRASLGEACFAGPAGPRRSAWDLPWLRGGGPWQAVCLSSRAAGG